MSTPIFPCSHRADEPMPSRAALVPEEGLVGATVLLANGDFPRHPLARGVLRSARRIVCCDGAADALARREPELVPAAVVGDFDSAGTAARRRYPARVFHRDGDQDTNDLDKAFRYALAHGWGRRGLVILGATGRREDHALGNVARLADFAAEVSGVRMVTDHGIFVAVSGDARIRCGVGRAVSIFSFDVEQRIDSEGLEWPLRGLATVPLWRATLNRAVSDEFTLRLSRPTPVLVYLAHTGAKGRRA